MAGRCGPFASRLSASLAITPRTARSAQPLPAPNFVRNAPHDVPPCRICIFPNEFHLQVHSDYRKPAHRPRVDPIDRPVPAVLYYPVSPEIHLRAVRSSSESVPAKLSIFTSPILTANAGEARGSLRSKLPAQIQPFLHFSRRNSPGINTSKIFSTFCNPLIQKDFKPPIINTSETKDLNSFIINTSKTKDLKSFIINTSKKQGRGEGGTSEVNKITHPAFSPRRLICTSRAHHDSAPAGRHKLAFFASRPGREAQGACPPCSWRRSPGYATPTTIYSNVFPEPRRGDTGFSLGTING